MPSPRPIPVMDGQSGLEVLKAIYSARSMLAGLSGMHAQIGDVFKITLPGFQPIVMVGPETNRYALVTDREKFIWRNERDPLVDLLRHGVLVEDGSSHLHLRGLMEPVLQRGYVNHHIEPMWELTEQVTDTWQDGQVLDMLVEMRRIALLIIFKTLFGIDFAPDMPRLWRPILRAIDFISPGAWLIWPDIPRIGFRRSLEVLDEYLFSLIRERRSQEAAPDDLLTRLVMTPEMSDDLIRDQLITMLIAGHDTSTALLSWTIYLFGAHPQVMQTAQKEVREVLGDDPPDVDQLSRLRYLDFVIKESLRLYPPIHVGNRMAGTDIDLGHHCVPGGSRVMLSYYLSHRDPEYWEAPDEFHPERFDRKLYPAPPPFTYVPFGGGPRNCIGAAFSQVEARTVLAYILKTFRLQLLSSRVHAHMGATIEPRPAVRMQVFRIGVDRD